MFDNSYARLPERFYAKAPLAPVPAERLLWQNDALARELGIPLELSVNNLPPWATPTAQAYAGHQFGHFVPSLGDGRACLLGEVVTPSGHRYDIALKGSGRTRFSRGGDGRAALGPMIREWLVSEAMHALGIPTTRTLALIATGETVYREAAHPGAILVRVAASHIRVGTFEYFAYRQDREALTQLVEHCIARHYPGAKDAEALLEHVVEAQARLISQWMCIGLIHGVMNTDNMTISGETIDYGPCAFMDEFRRDKVFSSIDSYGRYAYGNQPTIAEWNLSVLAASLGPLVDSSRAETLVSSFKERYDAHYLRGMRAKLGPSTTRADIESFLDDLERGEKDYTLAFAPGPANPRVIPRNHQIERAIVAAEAGDLGPARDLHRVLSTPFALSEADAHYALAPLPNERVTATFCGT